VEWLPLSVFDSHSQFAVALHESTVIDVNISGNAMTVTSFSDFGEYRNVNLVSAEEFELYLKHIMKNMAKKK